jgi:hypothetical protein
VQNPQLPGESDEDYDKRISISKDDIENYKKNKMKDYNLSPAYIGKFGNKLPSNLEVVNGIKMPSESEIIKEILKEREEKQKEKNNYENKFTEHLDKIGMTISNNIKDAFAKEITAKIIVMYDPKAAKPVIISHPSNRITSTGVDNPLNSGKF